MKGLLQNSPPEGCEDLTYIDRLNKFHLWLESNALPQNSQLMYFKLLNVFNRAGWPETVQVDNLRLRMMLDGQAETTVIRARDKLVEAGLLRYVKGKKGIPNRYSLTDLYFQNASVFASTNASINASISASTSASHIKTKTKKKTYPPKSPQGEPGESLEVETASGAAQAVDHSRTPDPQALFDRFWHTYPRRVGKGAARKAWEKLSPDQPLVDAILAAVERDKATDQWQRENGRYIPHPATWLNQQRWEDEPDTGPEPPPPPEPYRYPTPEEDQVRSIDQNQDWRDLI